MQKGQSAKLTSRTAHPCISTGEAASLLVSPSSPRRNCRHPSAFLAVSAPSLALRAFCDAATGTVGIVPSADSGVWQPVLLPNLMWKDHVPVTLLTATSDSGFGLTPLSLFPVFLLCGAAYEKNGRSTGIGAIRSYRPSSQDAVSASDDADSVVWIAPEAPSASYADSATLRSSASGQ